VARARATAPQPGSIGRIVDESVFRSAAYLVSAETAVTAARVNASHLPSVVMFGERWSSAELIAIDKDADIALLRLTKPAGDTPLELDPDARQARAGRRSRRAAGSWAPSPPPGPA